MPKAASQKPSSAGSAKKAAAAPKVKAESQAIFNPGCTHQKTTKPAKTAATYPKATYRDYTSHKSTDGQGNSRHYTKLDTPNITKTKMDATGPGYEVYYDEKVDKKKAKGAGQGGCMELEYM